MNPREQEPVPETGGAASEPRRWRNVTGSVLIALGCVALLPAVLALWLNSVVTDSDRYVSTVGPLASEPAVQEAVTDRVSSAVVTHVDVAAIVRRAGDELAERDVAPRGAAALNSVAQPIADAVDGWVHDQVGALVASERFATVWTEANRQVHDRVLAVLTGDDDARAVTAQDDTITLDLSQLISDAKQRLVEAGFGAAERVPETDVQLVLFQSDGVESASNALDLLDRAGFWLPVLAVVLIAAGVLVAVDRRRKLAAAGLGVLAAMVVLGVALAIVRSVYLDALPATVSRDAAEVVFDQALTYLRTTLRVVLVVGLVVAVAAYLAGPSQRAVAVRRGVARLGGRIRGDGWRQAPAVVWLRANKRPVEAVVAVVAVLVFVFWDQPTAGTVLAIAILAAVMVVVTELLTVPPSESPNVR